MRPVALGYDAAGRSSRLLPEQRNIHTYVIGSSGSGKSKFLESLIRGDLRNRQGFALLDPHGELYRDVVNYCAHHVLKNDIILLNLSSPENVIGFNPFQRAPEGDVSVQVDRRISATMHAWNVENPDQTPTLARTLRLIYTVMLEQSLGLPQVEHLIDFNAKRIRAHLIAQLQTPLIQKEWRELQGLDAKDWRQETLSAKNRLFKFLTSKTLARFMGIPGRSINLQEIMDEGKVLLVNLAPSDHLSRENAQVFGSLLVNEFFECALRRKTAFGKKPTPFYLYMDEFQNFVSPDIANALDEARKFGLFMVLAHQRFGQLNENVLEAALSHCGIKAVFGGLTIPNARRMAEELFIGHLDPMKIKVSIYQTKFWPTYARDKVYSRGTTHTNSSGQIEGSASGSSTGNSDMSYFQPEDWAGHAMTGITHGMSAGLSRISSSGSVNAESWGDLEGEADIPILLPVPFQELSNIQYYSPEEQLIELTAALKRQFPRHCFIQTPGQDTQPLLVPFIDAPHTSTTNRNWYTNKLARLHGSITIAEADAIIQSQENALLQKIASRPVSENDITQPEMVPKRSRKKSKVSPLDKLLETDFDAIGRE